MIYASNVNISQRSFCCPNLKRIGQLFSLLKHFVPYTGLLIGRGKKSQISRDFQGQIRGKNGRFRRNFVGICEASFAEK